MHIIQSTFVSILSFEQEFSFSDVLRYSQIFLDVFGCSRIFSYILGYSRIISDIPAVGPPGTFLTQPDNSWGEVDLRNALHAATILAYDTAITVAPSLAGIGVRLAEGLRAKVPRAILGIIKTETEWIGIEPLEQGGGLSGKNIPSQTLGRQKKKGAHGTATGNFLTVIPNSGRFHNADS
jgi:hypothetical protein